MSGPMFTVQYRSFGKWRRMGARSTLAEARVFMVERCPVPPGKMADNMRIVLPDGSFWLLGMEE